jgi:hypothetical protein
LTARSSVFTGRAGAPVNQLVAVPTREPTGAVALIVTVHVGAGAAVLARIRVTLVDP